MSLEKLKQEILGKFLNEITKCHGAEEATLKRAYGFVHEAFAIHTKQEQALPVGGMDEED